MNKLSSGAAVFDFEREKDAVVRLGSCWRLDRGWMPMIQAAIRIEAEVMGMFLLCVTEDVA